MHQPSPRKTGRSKTLPLSLDMPASLEAIIASFSDAVLVADASGRILLMNPAAERIFKDAGDVPVDDRARRFGVYLPDCSTLFPVEDLPLSRAIRGEKVEDLELFIRCEHAPEGSWFSASATPLRNEAGELAGGVVVLRDVTQKKHAEEQLRWERDRAAAIMETAGTLVVVLDAAGRIVTFNNTCETATGFTSEEVKGRCYWDILVAPDDVENAKARFARSCSSRSPVQYESTWVARDGQRRLIAWSNTALTDASGSVEHIVATGMDITGRKQIEQDLRQANDTLRAVIDTSPLAIVTMDLAGNVTSWNRAAEEIFGWPVSEVLGKPFPLIPDEDISFFRENLAALERGETIRGVERQRRRRDGTLVDSALWNAPHRDGSGKVIGGISVIADMTDRKRLEEQFRQAQKMEAVGRLAGGVAHDFNNLLTVITGYTQMLLDGLEEEHPMRSYVDEIVHASESAAALTNQLLAFSRRQIVSPQVLDLNTLVQGMDKLLHRLIGEDIELASLLAADLPKIKVDAGQFQQVLMNLAVNARDAMPEGGTITLKTGLATINEAVVDGPPPGTYVMLAVIDNGKGMTEEVRRRVFEPFYTTKGRGKGTGLGLSTVYGIVKQAGGDVTVESTPGRGSTFRILLPAIERATAAGVESSAAPVLRTGTETVLLVEDEDGLRKLVSEVLQAHGYTVLQAGDFREALSLCEMYSGPIHIVLTDMVMPGMSGRDLAVRVTQLRPRAKVLYMSGHTDHAVLRQTGGDASARFLQKPFTPEGLLAKVRSVLDT